MMRLLWAGATLALLVLACSSSDDMPATPHVGSGAGNCSGREGQTYLATYTERSGTCHLTGLQTVIQAPLSSQTADAGPDGCRGTQTVSADGCEISYDTDCPSKGQAGWRIKEQGKSKWSADGSYGTAIETIVLINETGATECASTGDFDLRRQ